MKTGSTAESIDLARRYQKSGRKFYNQGCIPSAEVSMSARMLILLLVVLVLAPPALAKDKKKQVLPDYVLRAQTLVVVIHPDAGEHLTNPTANRTAQDNVE